MKSYTLLETFSHAKYMDFGIRACLTGSVYNPMCIQIIGQNPNGFPKKLSFGYLILNGLDISFREGGIAGLLDVDFMSLQVLAVSKKGNVVVAVTTVLEGQWQQGTPSELFLLGELVKNGITGAPEIQMVNGQPLSAGPILSDPGSRNQAVRFAAFDYLRFLNRRSATKKRGGR